MRIECQRKCNQMTRFDDSTPDEEDVRAIWDALNADDPMPAINDDQGIAETIQEFHSLDSTPALSPALQETIWRSVQSVVKEIESHAPAFSTNGHHAVPVSTISPAIERESDATQMSRKQKSARGFRLLSIGVMSGAIAGGVAGGLGSRVAMRIAGSLSEGATRAVQTQDGNTVGSMSVGGTIFLVIFAALIGIAGGILYMPFRALVPTHPRYTGALYGASLLFIFGFVIMDKGNPDYRTFGSPAMNIGTFSACYVLFGIIIAPIAEWLNTALPEWPMASAIRWRNATAHALILFFGTIGCFAALMAILSGSGILIFSLGLSVICGLIARIYEKVFKGRPVDWRAPTSLVRNAMIGGPAVAGLAITIRSVASILGLG